MTDEKVDSPNKSPDLLYEDLTKIVEPSSPNEKTLPAALEMKKWLFEKRMEYAWNFFSHHAKQRMTMFQFFLLFVAFAVGGYATLLKDGNVPIATSLACFGAFLTVCFICLDRRNEELVHISEDVLESLESQALFVDYHGMVLWPRRRNWRGKMNVGPPGDDGEPKRIDRPLGVFRRQTADQYGWVRNSDGAKVYIQGDNCTCTSRHEHGRWMPLSQFCILVMFIFLATHDWIFQAWHALSTHWCPCS